jgi:hypothetical protein
LGLLFRSLGLLPQPGDIGFQLLEDLFRFGLGLFQVGQTVIQADQRILRRFRRGRRPQPGLKQSLETGQNTHLSTSVGVN